VAERLFGLETEYALVLLDQHGQRIPTSSAAEWLLLAARQQLCHLPDLASSGLFLANGARFYIDCGHHPEFAGPELANPWDAARYIKACEKILEGLGAELVTKHPAAIAQVCLFRQNVDYSGSGSTWGSHESYLHRADPALFRRHLLPHLVSRLIYTGSGGFDSAYPGIRFLLSPRVPHLTAEVSPESTRSRGILHTKDESLSSNGYHRLHLLCSESLFSEQAIFLRVGTTALIVAMIEAGLRPGELLELHAPLQAMQVFARDPRCQQTVNCANHPPLSALAIQRRYLALAEAHRHASFMPPWAPEVCRQWSRVLELLEAGSPESAATSLDWAIRYNVFEKFLQSQGYSWQEVERWNLVTEAISKILAYKNLPADFSDLGSVENEERLLAGILPDWAPPARENGAILDGFKKFRALRSRLFELDTRFGQLGNNGLFSQLERAGVLQHHIPGVDNFEHAMEWPPAVGRAKLRGECVRRLGRINASRTGYLCDWTAIWDQAQVRLLDLSDPFRQQADWQSVSLDSNSALNTNRMARHAEIAEMLCHARTR
jgi:proteasome accessory factor A